jgi:hypothetical protein
MRRYRKNLTHLRQVLLFLWIGIELQRESVRTIPQSEIRNPKFFVTSDRFCLAGTDTDHFSKTSGMAHHELVRGPASR